MPTLGQGLMGWIGGWHGGREILSEATLTPSGTRMEFHAGCRHDFASTNMTALLPTNYDTANHNYRVKLNRPNAELYIDGKLVSVILFGIPEGLPVWENTPPYTLESIKVAL